MPHVRRQGIDKLATIREYFESFQFGKLFCLSEFPFEAGAESELVCSKNKTGLTLKYMHWLTPKCIILRLWKYTLGRRTNSSVHHGQFLYQQGALL